MFAQLGDIQFELITYFSGIKENSSYNYAQHERINKKPILQFLGENLKNIDLKLNFHSSFCTPSEELEKLKDKEDELNKTVTKLQDPDYVARYAREKYLFSKISYLM